MIDAIVAREIKKTKLKKNILIPEIKIKTNQLKPIKRVWPISGWSIKRHDINIVNKKDKKYFKLKLVYFWEQIIILIITIKKGFTNSIGCILGNTSKSIHLFEPLISTPIMGTSNNKTNDKQKNITEILNISFSGIKERKKIKKKPKKTKTVCLKKKKYVFVSNLSDAIREVDTSEKNKPTKNKIKINDRIGLSILFHHW